MNSLKTYSFVITFLKVVSLLVVFSLPTTTVFAGTSVNNLGISKIWAGAYTRDGRANTRIQLMQQLVLPSGYKCSSTNAAPTDLSYFVIVDGVPTNNADGAGSLNASGMIQREYYHQQFTLLTMAQLNQRTVNVFLNDCTAEGRYAVAERVTLN